MKSNAIRVICLQELLDVALSSKKYDERAGAIGIILKCYASKFEEYLLETSNNLPDNLLERKKIKKMVHFINHFIRDNTSYVLEVESILLLCERIELQ